MKKAILIALFVFFLISAAGGAAYATYYFFFMPNDSMTAAFETEGLNLVVGGDVVLSKNPPKIIDDEILLPFDVVKEYIDPYIHWDDNLKKVTITTKDRLIRMKTNELEAMVNNKPVNLNIPAIEEDGAIFIPIEFLSDFYNIDVDYLKENNVIIIDYRNRMVQTAEPIVKEAVVRKGPSRKYPIIQRFDVGNNGEENVLRVFEEYEKWYKVRTNSGAIGYIEKKHVVVKWVTVNLIPPEEEKKEEVWKPENGKINLVWEMMYGRRPDLDKIGKIEGLDVISPTWFTLKNDQGELINRADATYVEWAHNNGYKVWALFSNDFQDIKATSRFLNNTDARDNAIRQLLIYASLYKLDGINIDFENIYKEDKDALTQFVRELTPLLKEQDLVVSIDVTIPDGSDTWSKCYDRKALGEIVDYVMLMTYDQHWTTSPVAGSVAQITWVEKNLIKVLDMVPKEKLLLGLPFYTRLWVEETTENGNKKVTNPQVLSMESAKKMVNENNAEVRWDEASGQFYAEFKKDGKTYKIWMEDENSINLKSSLVHKYKLAGTAAWRRSDESPEIWEVLNINLKMIRNYSEWKEKNTEVIYVYNR
ncbi:MAG: SH3 domain-containing protein [Firmicutes bacterium]|nr:SH3 domain-containing protein [Bacillota bacterium]